MVPYWPTRPPACGFCVLYAQRAAQHGSRSPYRQAGGGARKQCIVFLQVSHTPRGRVVVAQLSLAAWDTCWSFGEEKRRWPCKSLPLLSDLAAYTTLFGAGQKEGHRGGHDTVPRHSDLWNFFEDEEEAAEEVVAEAEASSLVSICAAGSRQIQPTQPIRLHISQA